MAPGGASDQFVASKWTVVVRSKSLAVGETVSGYDSRTTSGGELQVRTSPPGQAESWLDATHCGRRSLQLSARALKKGGFGKYDAVHKGWVGVRRAAGWHGATEFERQWVVVYNDGSMAAFETPTAANRWEYETDVPPLMLCGVIGCAVELCELRREIRIIAPGGTKPLLELSDPTKNEARKGVKALAESLVRAGAVRAPPPGPGSQVRVCQSILLEGRLVKVEDVDDQGEPFRRDGDKDGEQIGVYLLSCATVAGSSYRHFVRFSDFELLKEQLELHGGMEGMSSLPKYPESYAWDVAKVFHPENLDLIDERRDLLEDWLMQCVVLHDSQVRKQPPLCGCFACVKEHEDYVRQNAAVTTFFASASKGLMVDLVRHAAAQKLQACFRGWKFRSGNKKKAAAEEAAREEKRNSRFHFGRKKQPAAGGAATSNERRGSTHSMHSTQSASSSSWGMRVQHTPSPAQHSGARRPSYADMRNAAPAYTPTPRSGHRQLINTEHIGSGAALRDTPEIAGKRPTSPNSSRGILMKLGRPSLQRKTGRDVGPSSSAASEQQCSKSGSRDRRRAAAKEEEEEAIDVSTPLHRIDSEEYPVHPADRISPDLKAQAQSEDRRRSSSRRAPKEPLPADNDELVFQPRTMAGTKFDKRGFLTYVAFLVLFFVFCTIKMNSSVFYFNQNVRNIVGAEEYSQIFEVDDYYAWFSYRFLPGLSSVSVGREGSSPFVLVGAPRIRQVRAADCVVGALEVQLGKTHAVPQEWRDIFNNSKVRDSKLVCLSSDTRSQASYGGKDGQAYAYFAEDDDKDVLATDSHPRAGDPRFASKTGGILVRDTFDGSGFLLPDLMKYVKRVADPKSKPIASIGDEFITWPHERVDTKDLEDSGWIDERTIVIFHDLTLYNAASNSYLVLKLIVEQGVDNGALQTTLSSRAIYLQTEWSDFSFALAVGFYSFVVFLVIGEIRELRACASHIDLALDEKQAEDQLWLKVKMTHHAGFQRVGDYQPRALMRQIVRKIHRVPAVRKYHIANLNAIAEALVDVHSAVIKTDPSVIKTEHATPDQQALALIDIGAEIRAFQRSVHMRAHVKKEKVTGQPFAVRALSWIRRQVICLPVIVRDYFNDGWNYLDVINYSLFLYTAWIYWYIEVDSKLVKAALQDMAQDPSGNIHGPFKDHPTGYLSFARLADEQQQATSFNSANAVLTWVKLFKFLNHFPRMALLTRTLSMAGKPLLWFMLVLVIVVLGCSQSYTMAFGLDLFEFSQPDISFMALMRMAVGDFDYNALQSSQPTLGPLLFWMYIVLVFFVLMSMFIAIISDAYDDANSRAEKVTADVTVFGVAALLGGDDLRLMAEQETNALIQKDLVSGDIGRNFKSVTGSKSWVAAKQKSEEDSKLGGIMGALGGDLLLGGVGAGADLVKGGLGAVGAVGATGLKGLKGLGLTTSSVFKKSDLDGADSVSPEANSTRAKGRRGSLVGNVVGVGADVTGAGTGMVSNLLYGFDADEKGAGAQNTFRLDDSDEEPDESEKSEEDEVPGAGAGAGVSGRVRRAAEINARSRMRP